MQVRGVEGLSGLSRFLKMRVEKPWGFTGVTWTRFGHHIEAHTHCVAADRFHNMIEHRTPSFPTSSSCVRLSLCLSLTHPLPTSPPSPR